MTIEDNSIETQILEMLEPTMFNITVELNEDHSTIQKYLTIRDRTRTKQKLHMVEAAATRLALAMLKGTVKYPTDNHSIREWLEYALDDVGDGFQYLHLIKECLMVMEGSESWMDEPIGITLPGEDGFIPYNATPQEIRDIATYNHSASGHKNLVEECDDYLCRPVRDILALAEMEMEEENKDGGD